MALANMEYAKAFILEPTKLERLVDVIHELLAAHPNTTTDDRFDVFMTGNPVTMSPAAAVS